LMHVNGMDRIHIKVGQAILVDDLLIRCEANKTNPHERMQF
jgi:hypothetical protein